MPTLPCSDLKGAKAASARPAWATPAARSLSALLQSEQWPCLPSRPVTVKNDRLSVQGCTPVLSTGE